MKYLDKAIRICGTQADLAKKCGISAMAVSQWKKRGISVESAIRIETATNGGVTREQLRPDIFIHGRNKK